MGLPRSAVCAGHEQVGTFGAPPGARVIAGRRGCVRRRRHRRADRLDRGRSAPAPSTTSGTSNSGHPHHELVRQRLADVRRLEISRCERPPCRPRVHPSRSVLTASAVTTPARHVVEDADRPFAARTRRAKRSIRPARAATARATGAQRSAASGRAWPGRRACAAPPRRPHRRRPPTSRCGGSGARSRRPRPGWRSRPRVLGQARPERVHVRLRRRPLLAVVVEPRHAAPRRRGAAPARRPSAPAEVLARRADLAPPASIFSTLPATRSTSRHRRIADERHAEPCSSGHGQRRPQLEVGDAIGPMTGCRLDVERGRLMPTACSALAGGAEVGEAWLPCLAACLDQRVCARQRHERGGLWLIAARRYLRGLAGDVADDRRGPRQPQRRRRRSACRRRSAPCARSRRRRAHRPPRRAWPPSRRDPPGAAGPKLLHERCHRLFVPADPQPHDSCCPRPRSRRRSSSRPRTRDVPSAKSTARSSGRADHSICAR